MKEYSRRLKESEKNILITGTTSSSQAKAPQMGALNAVPRKC
jgi:hypothetical protein